MQIRTARSTLLILAAVSVFASAACSSTSDEPSQTTTSRIATSSALPASALRDWRTWYPYARGQGYGQRATKSWQDVAMPRGAEGTGGGNYAYNQTQGGQSTLRLPLTGTSAYGQPSNALRDSAGALILPDVFAGNPDRQIAPHTIDYYMNWWCDPHEVFSIGAHNCQPPTLSDGRFGWRELTTVDPSGKYLMTWASGSADFWEVHLAASQCNGDPTHMPTISPATMQPYLWGVAQAFNTRWTADPVCTVTLKYKNGAFVGPGNGADSPYAVREALASYVVPFDSSDGVPILHAFNVYMTEVLPTTICLQPSDVPAELNAIYPGASFPLGDTIGGIPMCATMFENYYMHYSRDFGRSNGMGSWSITGRGWGIPSAADPKRPGGLSDPSRFDYDHTFAEGNRAFVFDTCDFDPIRQTTTACR